jgi:hypothetical protein
MPNTHLVHWKLPVLEWSRGNTSTATSLGYVDQGSLVGGNAVGCLVLTTGATITAHRGHAAVESRRFVWVISPARPVVVSNMKSITACNNDYQ